MSDFSLNKHHKWSKREQRALKIFCYADFHILRPSPKRESSNLTLEKKSLAIPGLACLNVWILILLDSFESEISFNTCQWRIKRRKNKLGSFSNQLWIGGFSDIGLPDQCKSWINVSLK